MTFVPNYLRAGFKSIEEAFMHATKMIIEEPNCRGLDGHLTVMFCGKSFQLTPIKKKKNEKEPE